MIGSLISKTERAIQNILDKMDKAEQPHEVLQLSQSATELARTLELLKSIK